MPEDINDLIRRAFWAAREKGKTDWWRMTTAVLKNRMLNLTDRQFNEVDYGAKTVLEFASKFPDLLWLDESTYPPEIELRPRRLRADLWKAVTSYKASSKYAWDTAERVARPAIPTDPPQLILPKLTKHELEQWRCEFADRHKPTFSTADVRAIDRWTRRGLFHRSLPERLKGMWWRERSWRVWDQLADWFASRLQPEDIPTLTEVLEANEQHDDVTESTRSVSGHWTENQDADELAKCRSSGDWLGLGELIASRFAQYDDTHRDTAFAQVVATWAQPVQQFSVSSVHDLLARLPELNPEDVTAATINAAFRVRKLGLELPDVVADLAFKLKTDIEHVYSVPGHHAPRNLCLAAVAKLSSAHDQLLAATRGFRASSPTTAKTASIDLLRAAHSLRLLALAAERPYLRDLDTLLGVGFRKFCESCERHDAQEIARRSTELASQVSRFSLGVEDTRQYSTIWSSVIRPVAMHVADLLEEGTRQSERMSKPSLSLTVMAIKADLSTPDRSTTISVTLVNSGLGRAARVDLQIRDEELDVDVELTSPPRPFDLAGSASQVVSFTIIVKKACSELAVPLVWVCSDTSGKRYEFQDQLRLVQQSQQPNWDDLLLQPPYTLNPVSQRSRLFGRDAILQRLLLHATGSTSTFLWGQKRVGKTSVLQVLASELNATKQVACIFLRMGELISLHEGQIAFTIASRLNEISGSTIVIPTEDQFGAGLSRLIPVIEKLGQTARVKLVAIIDEFDDLDAAFYTGERGRQFVKALRSLSEVGLTFFFVGSERMDSIYNRHAIELNKWVNVSLDRIEAFADCKELIERPLAGHIEYEGAAVSFIVSYCGGNPFYMHLFCFEVFKRCMDDHRTYISATDIQVVRQHLLRTLGRTNFAHFWEDNPELAAAELATQSAENSLTLACIASVGGRFENVDDVVDAQGSLGLAASETAARSVIARSIERLRRRRVIALEARDHRFEIALPIFREWLTENIEQLLPTWRDFLQRESQRSAHVPTSIEARDEPPAHFPIPEDALLEVSQRLVYFGKQKDVAEVRSWLRQFDDDNRIEVAFLLLQRLAKNGYMTEGARGRTLIMLEEALQHRRNNTGKGLWKVVRGRKDNLCVTYVDSEVKSGASTAREIAKRVRAGKVADASNVGTWLKAHAADDALLLFVDDFAGSGSTLETGIQRFCDETKQNNSEIFLSERRILCYCQFAFPEALERLKNRFPNIEFFAASVFGDDVRALEPQAELFTSDEDRKFAREVLLQIGRELMPQYPLGWGDMGVLVAFHNSIPNNTLPIFWADGTVNGRPWFPLLPRA